MSVIMIFSLIVEVRRRQSSGFVSCFKTVLIGILHACRPSRRSPGVSVILLPLAQAVLFSRRWANTTQLKRHSSVPITWMWINSIDRQERHAQVTHLDQYSVQRRLINQ